MGVLLGINKVALRYQWDGINKVALRYQWAPTSTSALAMLWAHCGCFCQLLTRWLGCLGLRFAGPTHPPATTLPSPLPPTHPLIHDTRDITETFQKTFTKPVILTSCQLVYIMLAITLVYYWSKSGVATLKHQRNIVS